MTDRRRNDAKVEPEQRYADRFLGRDEFRWESEASTAPSHKKGRSIGQQQENGQLVHLFVRSQVKDGDIQRSPPPPPPPRR